MVLLPRFYFQILLLINDKPGKVADACQPQEDGENPLRFGVRACVHVVKDQMMTRERKRRRQRGLWRRRGEI